jgi:hypothetical protein
MPGGDGLVLCAGDRVVVRSGRVPSAGEQERAGTLVGASFPDHMDLPFAAELGTPPEPYERLLHDALTGDHSLFTREDAVEET